MRKLGLIGQNFGRLRVIGAAPPKHGRVAWRCKCSCKTHILVTTHDLRNGNTKSCGCLRSDMAVTKALANGTHGHARHGRESGAYKAWSHAKERCDAKPPHHHYALYAERGVVMVPEWRNSFERFLFDMGPCPPGATLDRFPDNNGNYGPGNCRWATIREQNNNRRNNLIVTFRGQQMTFAQAVTLSGAKHYCTAFQRYRRGWPIEAALTRPPNKHQHFKQS